MTATDDAPATPLPAPLDAALGRLNAALVRLQAAAADRTVHAGDGSSPGVGGRLAAAHAEALARLDRAEAMIRTVAGRLATASEQPSDEAP